MSVQHVTREGTGEFWCGATGGGRSTKDDAFCRRCLKAIARQAPQLMNRLIALTATDSTGLGRAMRAVAFTVPKRRSSA